MIKCTTSKTAVIDIGSNSFRLLLPSGIKKSVSVRLGEGLSQSGYIKEERMSAAVKAVRQLHIDAVNSGAKAIHAFATAAVRHAQNRDVFLAQVFEKTGLKVDVLSKEREGTAALLGVSAGFASGDGFDNHSFAVLDLGGASTELIEKNQERTFFKSFNFGAVWLYNTFKRQKNDIKNYILSEIENSMPSFPVKKLYAVGGTATTLAALEIGQYLPEKVHGSFLLAERLGELTDKLFALSVNEIKKLGGMDIKRADIIAGGAYAIYLFCQSLNLSGITVSESDNLEGYLLLLKNEKVGGQITAS